MVCEGCKEYKKGKGTKECLKCHKYLHFILKSNKRNPIMFEHIPQEIFNNIADTTESHSLIDLIRMLPTERSTPLMQQFFLNISTKEIANYHKISPQAVVKKNKSSLVILKRLLS